MAVAQIKNAGVVKGLVSVTGRQKSIVSAIKQCLAHNYRPPESYQAARSMSILMLNQRAEKEKFVGYVAYSHGRSQHSNITDKSN